MEQWTAVLAWLEQSVLGHAIRTSGVWTYGTINLAHILGIAILFGSVLVLDLRLLGWPSAVDRSAIVAVSVPLSIAGFILAAASGICMLATNGTQYADNPFLPIKFGAILLAVTNAAITGRSNAWKSIAIRTADRRQRVQLAVMGGISLFFWLTAISAGRMIGYW